MKHLRIYIFLLLLVLVLLALYQSIPTNPLESFDTLDPDVPTVQFPFKNIKDQDHQNLPIILISAPFRTEADEQTYARLKANPQLGFSGISSYLDFPGKIHNPHEDRFHEERNHDYPAMVSTWIHCFRTPPPNLANSNLPLLLLTEADLKDPQEYPLPVPPPPKEYDFVYSNLDDNGTCEPGWNWHNRNWDLAKQCLEVMCETYHLKGCIVGRQNCEFTPKCSQYITISPMLPFHEFQQLLQKSRFLFLPNISDASPRVLTEALCYNVPVLVNSNILGGWHNVVPGVTGEFFTDPFNLRTALDALIQNRDRYTPRDWFVTHRGREHSGKELAEFLKAHYPEQLRGTQEQLQLAYI